MGDGHPCMVADQMGDDIFLGSFLFVFSRGEEFFRFFVELLGGV